MMDWINDPALNSMDPIKKELFLQAAAKLKGKSKNVSASVLMSLITSANQQGIKFSSDEIQLILTLIKQGKSAQEKQQIDSMVRMVNQMLTKGKR